MKKAFRLTEPQLKELNEYEKIVRRSKVFKKLTVLRMKHNGLNNIEIATALNINRVSVGRWIRAFEADGLVGVARDNYKRKKSKLGLPEWIEIKIACEQGQIKGSWVLKRYVELHFGITYNQDYLRKRAYSQYGISFRNLGAPTS